MRVSMTQSRTSRRDREFLTLNLRLRDETEKKSPPISGIETRLRFIIFILRLRDENESSKLLTFPEVSDLNGLTNVHANPGRPTIINCAYDLSRIVFSIAFLLLRLQHHYCSSRRKFIAS